MAGLPWGSFPSWWVRARDLAQMRNGIHGGRFMAGLRVYFALGLLANYNTRSCQPTLSDLELATGLSKPMVLKGLRTLEIFYVPAPDGVCERKPEWPPGLVPLITTEHVGRRAVYTMTNGDKGFAKIPKYLLMHELRELPTRGSTALDALKLYLTLLSSRPNDSTKLKISHATIVNNTGIRPDRVKRAIDVLYEHGLIHLEKAETSKGYPMNIYELRGLDTGKSAPAENASASAPQP